MAEDWDLYAVVRSYTAAVATSTAFKSTTSITIDSKNLKKEDPFPSLASPPVQTHNSPFFHQPVFINEPNTTFEGLEEIYKELANDLLPIVNTSQSQSVNTTTASTVPVAQEPRQQQQQQQPTHPRQERESQFSSVGLGSSLSFPVINPQPVRPRRRKNQQTKMVRQMTQEELSADSWAWRKYGQKPIKGSPYPRFHCLLAFHGKNFLLLHLIYKLLTQLFDRNYYRCSTSKGCAARKQVERSPTDPNIFVVSYTGEHTHPRPTHRSSLAGSTRSKLPAVTKSSASTSNNVVVVSTSPAAASGISQSPTTTPEGPTPSQRSKNTNHLQQEGADTEDSDVLLEMMEENHDDEDQDILIPNSLMIDDYEDQDIFQGFQELNGSDSDVGALEDNKFPYSSSNSRSSLLSPPPWAPSPATSGATSSTTSANFASRGGC